MKKLLVLIGASLLLLLVSCGNKDGYTIKGDVKGLEGTVSLYDENFDEVQSVESKSGKFVMSSDSLTQGLYTLHDKNGPFAFVIIEKGTIKVNGELGPAEDRSFQNVEVTGTPANVGYTKYLKESDALYDELDMGDLTDEVVDAFSAKELELSRKIFEQNTDNYLGVVMLQNLFMTDETAENLLSAIDKLSDEFKNEKSIVQIKRFSEQMQKVDVGQPYIDIALPGADSEIITLSDYVSKGNYVLIDFWASWCGPCMAEIPHLTEAYAKYRGKGFEIFGVAVSDREDKWTDAIAANKMTWVQVFGDEQVATDYVIKTIPSNFLVSPEGTIIAKNLRGSQLGEKLAEIFGN